MEESRVEKVKRLDRNSRVVFVLYGSRNINAVIVSQSVPSRPTGAYIYVGRKVNFGKFSYKHVQKYMILQFLFYRTQFPSVTANVLLKNSVFVVRNMRSIGTQRSPNSEGFCYNCYHLCTNYTIIYHCN